MIQINLSPSSWITNGCIVYLNALPAKRFTPARRKVLALDPVNKNLNFLCSMRRCTSLSSSGIRCTSSITTQFLKSNGINFSKRPGSANKDSINHIFMKFDDYIIKFIIFLMD